MGEFAIEARGLSRRFGDITALDRVSLQVRQGEFFSLLGPSGCGKTTLLRLIAGLDVPDAGTLMIGGSDASRIPAHHRPVNTVFQSYALFPHMTVRDNIAFGLRMKKVQPALVQSRVEKIMQLVEITDLARRRPAQLSGGQRQRVALARAVVNEPDLLLLDEPLGALDLKLRRQLQVELHQLQQRLRITFIYVTHDQEEALAMSHRIAVMNAGRIEQLDTAQALYERPRTRFVAQFLGACNLFEATVRALPREASPPSPSRLLGIESAAGALVARLPDDTPLPEVGTQLTFAIRPEKIRLGPAAAQPLSENLIRAVVEDLIYSGAETACHLRAGDWRFKAVALNAGAGTCAFRPGETVSCHFDADALVPLAN